MTDSLNRTTGHAVVFHSTAGSVGHAAVFRSIAGSVGHTAVRELNGQFRRRTNKRGSLSLAVAATSIIFVATKLFVATKYFCHDSFVATNICRDQHNFVATKVL